MKLKFLTVFLAAITLGACNGDAPATDAQNTQTTIRFATESNFKPFSYLDNQGNVVGFEIDLVNALCKQMQADCKIESMDWDGLIPALNADKYDAIIAGMSVTPERTQVVDFTDPYFNNKLVLIGKKGVDIDTKDLTGKTIATQQATLASQWLSTNQPNATVKAYDKQDSAYLDLSAERVDGMLSDIVPATDWLNSDAGANFEIKGSPIDINDVIAIAVRKDDALKGELNAALAKLKQSGEYAQIAAKYQFDEQALAK